MLAGTSILASALQLEAFAGMRKKMAPSDRIHVAVVGINGMGWADLVAALKVPGVEVIMICDVDKNGIDKRMADLVKMNIDVSKIKTTGDYHHVLDNKDVDVVIIGTPDHWHALIMMEACAAAKTYTLKNQLVIL